MIGLEKGSFIFGVLCSRNKEIKTISHTNYCFTKLLLKRTTSNPPIYNLNFCFLILCFQVQHLKRSL